MLRKNILKGDLEMVNYDEFWDFVKEKCGNFRCKNFKEFSGGAIEGAININVDDLRANLEKLDKNKMYAIYCQVGLRGYLANRIMRNNGFNRVNFGQRRVQSLVKSSIIVIVFLLTSRLQFFIWSLFNFNNCSIIIFFMK